MYSYQINMKGLDEKSGAGRELQFDVTNHDDLFRIVDSVRSKAILDEDESAALAVGLKLLGEVVLHHRKEPLFQPLLAPIREFIQNLKTLPLPESKE